MIPSIGRTVHYVLPDGSRHPGHHRAAIISQVWTPKPGEDATEDTPVQLHVYMDAANDGTGPSIQVVRNATQDPFGRQNGSWHEPERVKVPEKPKAKELVPA